MNRVAPRNPAPGDNLDALLGAFFKSEKPAPWPAFRPPVQQRILPERPNRRIRWSFGSRVALAASVGLLVLGTWLLPSPVNGPNGKQPSTLPTIGGGTAGTNGSSRPGGQPGTLTPEKETKPEKQPGKNAPEGNLPFDLWPSSR